VSKDEQSKSRNSEQDDQPQSTLVRLLPSSKEEFEFARRFGLLARAATDWGDELLQAVMPNEATARALVQLIERERGGPVYLLVARQAPQQQNRWVVQLPLEQARQIGILPRAVQSNEEYWALPLSAPADAAQVRELELGKVQTPDSFLRRLLTGRWYASDRER